MTDKEFEAIRAEAREHVRRTSFPALPGSDDEPEFAPREHAEYGEARH
ncbi:hypothetical protein [Streptomyces roseolus]|nr:hypothetical protein [Streptomyces roseolus]GGR51277.1 hypothetical protein GCM10010282_50180 [Streptomyces roseolus]